MTRLSDEKEHWYVEMSDLSADSMVIQNAVKRDGRSGSKFRNGDTLLARITPCLENGKTGYVNFLVNGEAGRGSTEFIVLRSKNVTSEFVYCLARTYHFRENAIKSMVGSSGRQRVQDSCFEKFMILLPPYSLLESFSRCVYPPRGPRGPQMARPCRRRGPAREKPPPPLRGRAQIPPQARPPRCVHPLPHIHPRHERAPHRPRDDHSDIGGDAPGSHAGFSPRMRRAVPPTASIVGTTAPPLKNDHLTTHSYGASMSPDTSTRCPEDPSPRRLRYINPAAKFGVAPRSPSTKIAPPIAERGWGPPPTPSHGRFRATDSTRTSPPDPRGMLAEVSVE